MATQTVLLLIPPLTQLNTPYPSTAYLTGFLRSRGIACHQADIGIEMVLRLFSRAGLKDVFHEVRALGDRIPPEAQLMLQAESHYLQAIDPAVRFLQSRQPSLASRLLSPGFLPRGPRFRNRRMRSRSMLDRSTQSATFFLEDLTDLVQATVSPHFGMSRYAEHIVRAASSFDRILDALADKPSPTDRHMLDAMWSHINRVNPTLVGLSVPFPGNLYGAFRMAQDIKRRRPDIRIVLGGGYANTELRRVSDPRVFDFVDFITLDDGERPLLSLIEHLSGARPKTALTRTFYCDKDRVVYRDDPSAKDFRMSEVGCPTYDGLPLDRYLTILDSTNPMHRLWSEGHWNKLTVAHGCYWKQCTFCDVDLAYIARYEMTPIDQFIQQIERLIQETGKRDFHFVDEAAPPAALKSLALALLERGIKIRWWGNIRFEVAFTPDLCRLLAASGCIAVSAGLEAASDRLLEKMKKGITVDQTALVASAFKQAGILIHAYLMYGFPSETIQETIDSLERVRQLFKNGLVQSAFWHRFTVTAHSPIGLHPAAHGLRILGPEFQGFTENDLIHLDRAGTPPDWLGEGLRRSMLNYLEGRGLSMDVRNWFDHDMPKPAVSSNWVSRLLKTTRFNDDPNAERRFVWLGEQPVIEGRRSTARLILRSHTGTKTVRFPNQQTKWIEEAIQRSNPLKHRNRSYPLIREMKESFPGTDRELKLFLTGSSWRKLRAAGLLLV